MTFAVGEDETPKLANVVNAVFIEKNATFPEQMKMCGSKVWLAKMKMRCLSWMDVHYWMSRLLDGRCTELVSMDSHKAGRIVSADEAHSFAKKHGIRIIPTRWVLGPKVVNWERGSARPMCGAGCGKG